MRTSTFIILSIALLTAVSLIPTRRAATTDDQNLLFTVWGMPFEDLLFRDGYAADFEKENPGWTVTYQRHPDLIDKYNAWHVRGTGADVMRVPIDVYHQFVAKGMLAPLNEFIHDPEIGLSAEEIADYFPQIWSQLDINGRIYALPSDNAQFGVYFNRAAFKRYNKLHPDTPLAYPNAEWTWDDLRHAAAVLTQVDESGRTTQYGIMFDLWAWPFMTFFAQAGGELWDADETTTFINSDIGVETLEYMVSIIPADAPIRAADLAASAASPAELFKSGRLAILLDGSWRAPNIELDSPALDFAIAPLPHFRKRAVVSGSVVWAVSAHSKHPRKAWEMVRWMTNFDQSLRYWDWLRVAPPARMSVVKSDAFRITQGLIENGQMRTPPMPAKRYEDRAAWLKYAITPDPVTGTMPGFVATATYQKDLQDKITAALVAAVRGERPPKDALDKAAKEVHKIIDRDRAAKGLEAVDRD